MPARPSDNRFVHLRRLAQPEQNAQAAGAQEAAAALDALPLRHTACAHGDDSADAVPVGGVADQFEAYPVVAVPAQIAPQMRGLVIVRHHQDVRKAVVIYVAIGAAPQYILALERR